MERRNNSKNCRLNFPELKKKLKNRNLRFKRPGLAKKKKNLTPRYVIKIKNSRGSVS